MKSFQLDPAERVILDHFTDTLHNSMKMHKELGGTYQNYPANPSNIIDGLKNLLIGK